MTTTTFFIDAPKKNIIAALLTSTIISHSYEVETTRDIVNTWMDIRDNIALPDDAAVIAAILTNGRLLDVEEEIKGTERINVILESIKTRLPPAMEVDATSTMAAMLTSAFVARSNEIETTKSIVETFYRIRDTMSSYFTSVMDDSSQIAAILSWGRLLELKGSISNMQSVIDTYEFVLKELRTQNVSRAGYAEFGAAFITSAYVQISPKVERIKDIVESWNRNRMELGINDQGRYVASILASGKIRDASASELSMATGARDTIDQIYTHLRAVY